jgi:hypothetical protein
VVDGDRRVFFAHVPFAQMVEAKIGDDAVNPGVEGTLEAEAPQVFVGLQKGLLVDILRVGFRSGQVQSQAKNGVIVMTHEHLEGCTVSLLRLADQSRIVNAVALRCQGAPHISIQRGVLVAGFWFRPPRA